MNRNYKAIISLILSFLAVFWYFNVGAEPTIIDFEKIEIKISLVIAILSFLIALHFFSIKVVGFRDFEVFEKIRYLITLNFYNKKNKYKSRVYTQRAVCPEIEFKFKEKRKIDNNTIFLFRSNEEILKNDTYSFIDLEKRDYQKYTKLLKRKSRYKVITYKDIHIWTLSFYDDLLYYINDFKKFKHEPCLLNRLFVLDDNISNTDFTNFVKLLRDNTKLDLKQILNNILKKDKNGRKALDFNGLVNRVIEPSKVKQEYKIKLLFLYFALFVQNRLGINCYVISKEKFEKQTAISSMNDFWEFSGLGVFDDHMTALVYKGPSRIYNENTEKIKNDELIIKYKFQFKNNQDINDLFDDNSFDEKNIKAHSGLNSENQDLLIKMSKDEAFLRIVEFYAELINYLSLNKLIRKFKFKKKKNLKTLIENINHG